MYCYRQSWATQFYHDVAVVCIGVDAADKEEAQRCMSEEFPNDPNLYEICDPWESSYQPGSDSPNWHHRDSQIRPNQMELYPGISIVCRGKFFLFSFAVINPERGVTVAYATNPRDVIVLDPNYSYSAYSVVGSCMEAYKNLQRQSGEKITADLALLKLKPNCLVDNIVRWPFPAGRTLQIKIYDGQKVPDDTGVMILDQNRDFQYGYISRDHLTDIRLQDKNLHNVLAISTKK